MVALLPSLRRHDNSAQKSEQWQMDFTLCECGGFRFSSLHTPLLKNGRLGEKRKLTRGKLDRNLYYTTVYDDSLILVLEVSQIRRAVSAFEKRKTDLNT